MTFDIAIIGAGPGGYVAAIRAAQLGMSVICFDKRKTLGGTCLNIGCIPSKVLLHDTEHSRDFSQIMQRKKEVVLGFTKGIEALFKKNKITFVQAEAELISPNTIEAAGKKFEAKSIILALGSVPQELPFLPFDEKTVLSSTGALDLSEVPKQMLVVGAGIIGVELGSVYQRLGTKVRFIEFLDRICPNFEPFLSKALLGELQKQGMEFFLSHKVLGKEGTSLIAEGPDGERKFEIEKVLVAIGRKPASDQPFIEKLRIEKDPKGFLKVDEKFQTNIPHVFAIGDLIEGPMLAHKASEEGIVVVESIAGKGGSIQYAFVPSVAYTSPEVASVGLKEKEICSFGIEYVSSQFPFLANSRARCIDAPQGFIKIYAEKKEGGRILGVHMIGANASELIAEATLAIQLKASKEALKETCFAHPTLSECLKEAALGLIHPPIHI